MRHIRGIPICGALFVLAACMLAGCVGSSQNAKFYTLSSIESPEPSKKPDAKDSVMVAVGPIRIPEYLDRPQIMTRTGKNELVFSEFQRWGGSLENELQRVMAVNIGGRLGGGYAVVNWPSAGIGNLPFVYRVSIDILQFEKVSEHDVVLKAQWGIIRRDNGERLFVNSSSIREQVTGTDYEALVAAMSRAAAGLTGEIAAEISSLPRPATK